MSAVRRAPPRDQLKTPPSLSFQELSPDLPSGLFDCGKEAVNRYIRKSALKEHNTFKARVHTALNEDGQCLAFYALHMHGERTGRAAGSVGKIKSDAAGYEHAVPVVCLSWLGVHKECQRGTGLRYGEQTLEDAVIRTAQIAQSTGMYGLLVQALDEEAKAFFESWNFDQISKYDPKRLLMPTAAVIEIASSLKDADAAE